MILNRTLFTTIFLLGTTLVWSQTPPATHESVPIYRVTVVERTVKAVDYQYRRGPTPLDFRGTVLLPHAKGDAVVESKAGHTDIDARFDHLEAPTRYGPEYLTYVLWAITPQGHPKNLGEILPGSSDKAHLRVTTDLQAFGMIVTAEPYSAVRQPSDVVVMENEVRPETVGGVEQIQARYELMPRGEYTYNVTADIKGADTLGERVSMDRYEEILEIYQAQNAVQIARAGGADRYASDVMNKADALLETARDDQMRHADRSTVVTAARQAAQTAEDARAITQKRRQDEQLASAQQQIGQERELRARAEADLQALRNQASADRVQLDQERVSRERAQTEAEAARALPPPPPPQPQASVSTVVTVPAPEVREQDKTQLRLQLTRDLNSTLACLDTPRGIVVTVPDGDFRGSTVSPALYASLQRVAALIAAHPGLYVQVDGHTDNTVNESRAEEVSYERAAAVRQELARAGVPASNLSARGLGSSHPRTSNGTAAGREENRRVEITISGDPIGSMPYWDKTYSLAPR